VTQTERINFLIGLVQKNVKPDGFVDEDALSTDMLEAFPNLKDKPAYKPKKKKARR
jgi:hypothetical protein